MNAARIQFQKKSLSNTSLVDTQMITTIEGDYIETKNVTCLDPALKSKNDPYCHFCVNKILAGQVKMSVLDLPITEILLDLNQSVTIENSKDQETYILTLISTKTDDVFTGIEF